MPLSKPARESNHPAVQLSFFTRLIATGFFSGYFPWASGTLGSLVGVVLYLIPGVEHTGILAACIVVALIAGVITSHRVALAVGNQLTKNAELAKATFQSGSSHAADPSIVVIDEIVGMWISLMMLPKTISVIVTAFVLFRVFDIIKPPPARNVEAVPKGWGIMLDDVVAGIYANAAVRLLMLVVPSVYQ